MENALRPNTPHWISRFRDIIVTSGSYLASASWIAVALTTVIDSLGRAIFSTPIYGAFELVKLFMATGIFFSILIVAIQAKQISVQLLSNKFPQSIQRLLIVLSSLIGAACFAVIACSMARSSIGNFQSGETTTLLELRYWAISGFMSALSGLAAVCCLVSLCFNHTDEGPIQNA